MNEFLSKRILRKLETLPEQRIYQVLDYIEFLESRYAERSAPGVSPFQRLAETVENTLRAGRMSATVVRGTMDAMSAAGRVMEGLAAAGKSVVEQVSGEHPRPPAQLTQGATPALPKPEEKPPESA